MCIYKFSYLVFVYVPQMELELDVFDDALDDSSNGLVTDGCFDEEDAIGAT